MNPKAWVNKYTVVGVLIGMFVVPKVRAKAGV